MPPFATMALPSSPSGTAPDGTDVRPLLALAGGSFAHFTLAAGAMSAAVAHRTVEEIWYIVGGGGEMWRQSAEAEAVVPLEPGTCLTIPLGTRFQFRSTGPEPLAMVVVTMPPWPGDAEAFSVSGRWTATVMPE